MSDYDIESLATDLLPFKHLNAPVSLLHLLLPNLVACYFNELKFSRRNTFCEIFQVADDF